MKLYHLGYCYGSYDDREEVYLGTFSSKEIRNQIKDKIVETANLKKEGWLYCSIYHQEGRFVEWESELDEREY